MVLLATLRRSGGIQALARSLAVPPPVATAAVTALLPLVVGGFRRCVEVARSRGERVADLPGLLADLGGGGMAALVMGPGPIQPDAGAVLAERIFTDAQGVRTVAKQASANHGLELALVTRMLPLLTMLVGGYLAARAEALSQSAGEEDLIAEMETVLAMTKPNPLDAVLAPRSAG